MIVIPWNTESFKFVALCFVVWTLYNFPVLAAVTSFAVHVLICVEQDFSSKWIDAVKAKVKDSVCARVYEEADGIRKAVPALKFALGEPFKDEHWTQVHD